jgi:transposase
LRWIGAGPVARIRCGPTNRTHRALETRLAAAGLPLAPVNPLKARRFAQALGLQAKTDRIDARMLAEMGQRLTPGLQVPNPKNLQHLKDLVAARRALVADRVADGNRTEGHSLALLRRLARRRRAAIEADIARIEAAIAALIAADPALTDKARILQSLPGVAVPRRRDTPRRSPGAWPARGPPDRCPGRAGTRHPRERSLAWKSHNTGWQAPSAPRAHHADPDRNPQEP